MWLSYEYAAPSAQGRDPAEVKAEKIRYARRHLALTRACVDIDAFLKSHGVIGMIRGEREHGTMNSALVAVLGIAVKKQDVGFGMFATPAGHAHLKREFSRYFELSPDNEALDQSIAAAQAAVAEAQRALDAWPPAESGR